MVGQIMGLNDSKLRLIDPVVYLEFLSLQKNATVVITNSGGIQDSTYVGYYDGLVKD